MINNKILEKAEKMKYKFLFHSKEQEEDFLRNDASVVIESEDGKSILFVETDGTTKCLYFAGESLKNIIASLKKLNEKFEKGTKIQVSVAVGDFKEKQLQEMKDAFIEGGCILKYHFMGYKTDNLKGKVINTSEVAYAGMNNIKRIYELLDNSLGGEKAHMGENDISEFISDPQNKVFIIYDGLIIAGVVFAVLFYNKYKDAYRLFIRCFAVDEKYRGKGYGSKLMKKAFMWAEDNKAVDSMLWVEKDNKTAIKLYEEFGYKPYGDEEANLEYVVQ